MSTTFVTLGRSVDGQVAERASDKEVGFWMRDEDLGLWLRLLSLHVDDPPPDEARRSCARDIRNEWLLASRWNFAGCIPHSLDTFTSTEPGAGIAREAVRSLLAALACGPDTLSAGTLNLMELPFDLAGDVQSARLACIAQAFLDLLDNRIAWTAGDAVHVPGAQGWLRLAVRERPA